MSGPDERANAAEDAYADFLARSEREADLTFEAFCGAHPELEEALRRLHARWNELSGVRGHLDAAGSAYRASTTAGDRTEPVTLDPSFADGSGDARDPAGTELAGELLRRLQQRSEGYGRYRIQGEIGRGGMGRVLRVWDPDLRRTLAMKVVRREGRGSSGADPRLVARFLEEAQISGQLDHPGIVPLHEIGMAPDGEVYFTMKLVAGESLREVFARCERGEPEWTRPRVVGVLLKVCEAVSYAHAKGVVHRDLKPTNVMVGHFGEVYVMDWGLARILGTPRRERAEPATGSAIRRAPVASDRHDASDTDPDSPVVTVEGDVIGTPAYMSPEQAQGVRAGVGPRADVYSIGAMLYQHLTRRVPYVRPGESVPSQVIVARVRSGPPTSIERLAPAAPAELTAICERAMAREPGARYASVAELGDDLRAFLEGRVVRAYRTGALVELRKWVARNRAQAASALLAVVALVAGLVVSTSLLLAVRSSEARVLRMSDVQRLRDLDERADALYPAYPALEDDFRAWLEEAEALLERLDLHRATLAELRRGAPGLDAAQRAADRERHPRHAELELWTQRRDELAGWLAGMDAGDPEALAAIAAAYAEAPALPTREEIEQRLAQVEDALGPLAEEVGRRRTWAMPTTERQWEHDTLAGLVEELEAFADPERGRVADVRARLESARRVGELSHDGPEARERWREARAAIASSAEYGGLELAPQMGLLPIGPDPWSGLWEFALVATGEVPRRDAEGVLRIGAESALVLVLVPGGSFWMGAQAADPAGRNHDPLAEHEEGPVHRVKLAPFFLSKYEMTQGQWARATGSWPSYYKAGNFTAGRNIDGRHPVEQVSWLEAANVLARLGLELPTEAQWEHAVRAWTDTPWFDGREKEALIGAANLCDATARRSGAAWPPFDDWLDDGHMIHAPVGTYRPNPWGLHEMYGNVIEHTRDHYGSYARPTAEGTGERIGLGQMRVLRGGSFDTNHETARASRRSPVTPTFNGFNVGVRPARGIE